MKLRTLKALVGTSLALLPSVSCFAQGTIIFNNSSSQMINVYVRTSSSGGPAPLGTHVAFYYSPTAVTDPFSSSMHLIENGIGTIAPVPGQFNLGIKTTDTDAAPGSSIWATVRAWYSAGNAYTTWEQALAAAQANPGTVVLGATSVFQMPTGGFGQPPNLPVPLSTIAAFTGLTIGIPEPTTFPLCGLGAAALLIFRRRN